MNRNELGFLGDCRNDGLYYGEPGATADERCGVCGTECVVERNINGPTSWAGAMTGHKRLHDVFRCPHYYSGWHEIAYKLAKEYVATASKRLRALIETDLDELLETNLPKAVCADSRKTFATDAAGNQVEISNGPLGKR
jgi:hypothetical protein